MTLQRSRKETSLACVACLDAFSTNIQVRVVLVRPRASATGESIHAASSVTCHRSPVLLSRISRCPAPPRTRGATTRPTWPLVDHSCAEPVWWTAIDHGPGRTVQNRAPSRCQRSFGDPTQVDLTAGETLAQHRFIGAYGTDMTLVVM